MKFTMRAEKIRLMAEKRKATILEEITSIWLALLCLLYCLVLYETYSVEVDLQPAFFETFLKPYLHHIETTQKVSSKSVMSFLRKVD